MYEAFYGLTRRPFENTPNPEFFFASKQHREALAALVYGIKEAKGFMLITGDVGAGKTFLVQSLKYEMEDDDLIIVEAASPWISPEELLDALPEKLGMKPDPQWNALTLQERLKDKLKKRHAQGRRIVVIVDEAQQLPERTLEGIRLLSNFETENAKLIQIILLGQPELNELLARHSMRQVRQRIVLSRSLTYLSLAETKGYIEHRLKLSGQSAKVFDDESVGLIYRVSQGAPRLINLVCDNCLITGYAHSSRMITPQIVRESIKELPMVDTQVEALQAPAAVGVDKIPAIEKSGVSAETVATVSEPRKQQRRSVVHELGLGSVLARIFSQCAPYARWAVLLAVLLGAAWFVTRGWLSTTLDEASSNAKEQAPVLSGGVGAMEPEPMPRYVSPPEMEMPVAAASAVTLPTDMSGTDEGSGSTQAVSSDLPLYMQMRQEIGSAHVRDDVVVPLSETPAVAAMTEEVLADSEGTPVAEAPVKVGDFSGYVRSQHRSARYGSGLPLAYPFDALALQLVDSVKVPNGSTISQTARKQYGTWNDTVQDMVKALNPAFGGDLNNVDTRLGINLPEIKRAHLIVNQPGSGWYAYVGTLTSRSRANYLFESFTKLGEPADMVIEESGGSNLYRVYIGPYEQPQDVMSVLEDVRFVHMPFLN